MSSQYRVNGINEKWTGPSEIQVEVSGGALVLRNSGKAKASVQLGRTFKPTGTFGDLELQVRGEMTSGSGFAVIVNDGSVEHYPIPLNSKSQVPIKHSARVRLQINGNTTVRLDALELAVTSGAADPFAEHLGDGRVLLVTPTYPSSNHLYLSGFVHARVHEYRANGLEPVVFCAYHDYQHRTVYEFEGVTVLRGNTSELLAVLNRWKFEKILVHFFDEFFALALDRGLKNLSTETILWCHGPETLFWDLPAVIGPYFQKPQPPDPFTVQKYRLLEHNAKKFNQRKNVRWVFVSDWQRRRSEELLGIQFRSAQVIPNVIDDTTFRFQEKDPELRKNVFILRRYDNEKKYAVDVTVQTILELSRKPFFKELRFNVYGDGGSYQQLLSPIAGFDNVVLHRRFVDHQGIAEIHRQNGVALFPTRYDAQGVSACEAASSGLAVVSTHNTAIPEFIPDRFGTLARSDDPREYARIIEALYRDPVRFTEVSRGLSEHVRSTCSYETTIKREVALIREPVKPSPPRARTETRPIDLTVVVPTYNMEKCLERCVESLLDGHTGETLEVLIIDDGSKDGSLALARTLEQRHPASVRVIAKENGGHGSTINVGIAEAKGRYLRVVDSDDWVDAFNFARFLERLRDEDADVVLTDYSEDWEGTDALVRKDVYGNLTPGVSYGFETLADPTYGFRSWGPVLATASFKTEALRSAGVRLDEKIAYVDMEFSAFAIRDVHTVKYYELDVYRYALGRATQTVSAESFKKKYKQHEQVIFRICDFLRDEQALSEAKRRYILKKLLKPMVEGHYGLLTDSVRDRAAYAAFDAKVRGYAFLREELDGFLHGRRRAVAKFRDSTRNVVRNLLPFTFVANLEQNASSSKTAKYVVKYFAPYGLIMRLKR